MKRFYRLSISKKVFLLTAALSMALILVSVTVASVIFNVRAQRNAKKQCGDLAETLSEYVGEKTATIDGSGKLVDFIPYYRQKLDAVYRDRVEEIEEMSAMVVTDDDKLAEKKAYFSTLTANIFGSSSGFGLSLEASGMRAAYTEIIDEMERMAAQDGIVGCEIYYYDEENDNIVFLCDSSPERAYDHAFPGSVEKPSESFSAFDDRKTSDVYQLDEFFASFAPIKDGGETVAYVSFYYSIATVVDSGRDFLWTLVGIMIAATAVILAVYLFLANNWLVKNVRKLSLAAQEFSSRMEEGELKPVDADIKTKDEIKDLSDEFFELQNKVVGYAEDIARKSVEEERLHSELTIASKIQMQSLPDKPLIAGDIRISSFIKPAKEVGGDLFDYFVTKDGKLFFVIADVSGKGVPAALFMMRGKEIIRSCAKAGMSAAKIAETVNDELCSNNKEGLFITAFIGIYDKTTGKLSFARAGHEQPFLLRGGVAGKIGEESNFVLGAFGGMSFVEDSVELKEGDKIFLYTDGLNEGINENFEEYGYDRIKMDLEGGGDDILRSVYEKATEFSGGTEQFDDITMLLLEKGKSVAITLLSPDFKDIPVVTDRITEELNGCDEDKKAELGVIIDELMNNYISYAFEGVEKPVLEINFKLFGADAELTFVDNGKPFNPLKKEAPDVEADLADRPFGGLGITIVKSVADGLEYSYAGGKNRLTVKKKMI